MTREFGKTIGDDFLQIATVCAESAVKIARRIFSSTQLSEEDADMKIMLSSFAVLFFTTGAFAGEVLAPFGLTWGETKSQLEAKGVVRGGCERYAVETCRAAHSANSFSLSSAGALTSCIATPAKPAAFGEFYLLVFDSANKLQCAGMSSGDIPKVFTGSEGKALYARAKSSLGRKYGEPATVKDQSFCIESGGCENFGSVWEPGDGGRILLYLRAAPEAYIKFRQMTADLTGDVVPPGLGSLHLEYESPERAAVERARKNLRKKQEEKSDDSAF